MMSYEVCKNNYTLCNLNDVALCRIKDVFVCAISKPDHAQKERTYCVKNRGLSLKESVFRKACAAYPDAIGIYISI